MTSFGTELHYSDNALWSGLVFFSVLGFISFHLFPTWYYAYFPPISLLLPSPFLPFSHGYIHTSSSIAYLPFFLAVCDIKWSRRREGYRSKAPSLLSDRPQSHSLTLSAVEVYTHGKLIPMPCLPHIVLMSKVVRCVETGVTFSKDRHTVGSHCTQKQHIERKWWRAAGLMNWET